MEPIWIGLISVMAVFFILCLCLGLSGSKWNYSKYIKERNERVRRKRWNKYVRFLNPENEKELYQKIKSSSDVEFNQFLKDVSPLLKRKYYSYEPNEHTQLKRGIYNVVNRFTNERTSNEFDYDRLKKLEYHFPMLKRVYFGPRLTHRVYSKDTLKRKFKYTLKIGCEIPKLETIIDVAFFFNTSVNNILGLCYMQEKKPGPYYIKRKIIYERFKSMDIEPEKMDLEKFQIDSSFAIPEPKKLKESKPLIPRKHKEKEVPDIKIKDEPFLKENSSPFYLRTILVKPDGRKRLIARPDPFLMEYQRLILGEILEKAELPDSCTGFVKNRSIVTNARNHVGAQTLVKIDLKNFFNTLRFYHAFEVFRGFGYNRPVSGILACICTDWYTKGGRYVPQGAPSSPMIGNLYAMHLDKRLEGLWTKHKFRYSRYADDLTFSNRNPKIPVRGLIHATYKIIQDEKLYPNFEKTKVFRKQHKKSVTGITVNEKVNVDRKWLNTLRGELYRYSKYGLSEDSNEILRILSRLKGKLAYLKMICPDKARKYNEYLDILMSRNSELKCSECGKKILIQIERIQRQTSFFCNDCASKFSD